VVSNVAICHELASRVNQYEKAVQDFGSHEVLKMITTLEMAMMEQHISIEEKEAALVNLKKALKEKEAGLSERDVALKDALAREEKVKQDYREVRKLITALQMAMTAEEQNPVLEQMATLLNLDDPAEALNPSSASKMIFSFVVFSVLNILGTFMYVGFEDW
jgi:septal ring factor EnvC (AmiA/AmiB activator)